MQQAASSKNSLFKTSSSLDSIEASGNCVTSQGPSANLVLSKSCPLFFSLQAFSFHGNVAFVVALGSELRRINLAVGFSTRHNGSRSFKSPPSKRQYQARWTGLQGRDWKSWSERSLVCGGGRVVLG